jgi:hypothetical protein
MEHKPAQRKYTKLCRLLGVVGTTGVVFASHVMLGEFVMPVVCSLWEEKRIEVKAGRRDIYTRATAIAKCNMFCWLKNTKRGTLHLAQPPGTL